MRKKKLLSMSQLYATEEMLTVARENPVHREKGVTRGIYRNHSYIKIESKYARYFRAAVEDGILHVTMFNQSDLERGKIIPAYEVFCDKESREYITYDHNSGGWRGAKIDFLECPDISYQRTYLFWQSEEDRRLVNEYFLTGTNRDIYAAVLDFQADIKAENLQRKHRTELDQIDEVMREVPEVPADFEEWIQRNGFTETMFYEPESMCKGGKWPRMYCTHCRHWMDTRSYPDRPEHGKTSSCPSCGVEVEYKSWNKQKIVSDISRIGLLQRLNDDSGWILRAFECRIIRRHEKGWEDCELHIHEDMREKLDNYFVAREFFEYGEYKNTHIVRWCHNRGRYVYGYGYYIISEIGSLIMYTPNLNTELSRESFGRMDLEQVMSGRRRKEVRPKSILFTLRTRPYLEYIQKSGLNTLLMEIVGGALSEDLFDKEKKRIHEVLRLDKQRFRRMQSLDGDSRILRALQHEQQTGQKLSDHNITFIRENVTNMSLVIELTRRTGMSIQRMLNYLEKQMGLTGQEFGDLIEHYRDYLEMAAVFGMDIHDDIVCRQPAMMEYHDRYAERKNREKNKSRDAEVDYRYPQIKENAKKTRDWFSFSTEEFKIVVPSTASDITREGRKQHHCVGASDRYISSMAEGQTFILFLRRKDEPKKPYYTLEVTPDGRIKQFYAAYDRQPDKEKIEAVLKEFTECVRARMQEHEEKLRECEARDNTKMKRIGITYQMIPVAAV